MIALLITAVAAVFWPGVPMYDTVAQYDQVLSGDVEDWHPPVMVRLWQVLAQLGPGAAPMFVLQVTLYAVGVALIVAALARAGRPFASIACALLSLSPLILGWQMVVLKDAQMLGALIAAVGIVAHYRLRGAAVPAVAGAGVLLLIAYATLVRANALFATIPLCTLLPRAPRSLVRRGIFCACAIVLLLGLEPVINHRVFNAAPSGVQKSQPLFDLAAVAVAEPQSVRPFMPRERTQLMLKNCVKSFFWDPLGEPSACGAITARVNAMPASTLYVDLAEAASSHPIAYGEHRLKHWNSTERWLVPPGLIDAAPPILPEPNDDGLVGPTSAIAAAWQSAGGWLARTPIGWPILWTVVALLLLPIAWRSRRDDQAQLAFALLVSALTLEASFLVVSIASDLRYHLWSMTAAALALVLLGSHLPRQRSERLGVAAVLIIVLAGGFATRTIEPPAPNSYQAMLRAPVG